MHYPRHSSGTKTYTLICIDCGESITAKTEKKMYCDPCRVKRRELYKQQAQQRRTRDAESL